MIKSVLETAKRHTQHPLDILVELQVPAAPIDPGPWTTGANHIRREIAPPEFLPDRQPSCCAGGVGAGDRPVGTGSLDVRTFLHILWTQSHEWQPRGWTGRQEAERLF